MKLKDLCTQQNLKRSTLLGDVHTIEITQNGEKRLIDIEHIALPFNQQRIALVKKAYGITDMNAIYRSVAQQLVHAIRTGVELKKSGMQDIVACEDVEVDKTSVPGETHTYMMMPHISPIRSFFNRYENITYNTIMDVAGRLSMIVRDLASRGYSHGNICEKTVFVDENGHYLLGDLRYVSKSATQEKLSFDLLPFDGLRESLTPTGYDMYAATVLVCDMLGGFKRTHYAGIQILPDNVIQELQDALIIGFRANPDDVCYYRRLIYEARKQYAKSALGTKAVL